MSPIFIVVAALVTIVVVALAIAAISAGVALRGLAARRQALEAKCAALGLERPPQLAAPSVVACAGERQGERVVVTRVDRGSHSSAHGPHLRLTLESHVVPGGDVRTALAASEWTFTGEAHQHPAIEAVLTPELRAAAAAAGGVSVAPFARVERRAVGRVVHARWPDGWRGWVLSSWVDVDASPAEIDARLESLRAFRDALSRDGGIGRPQ